MDMTITVSAPAYWRQDPETGLGDERYQEEAPDGYTPAVVKAQLRLQATPPGPAWAGHLGRVGQQIGRAARAPQ